MVIRIKFLNSDPVACKDFHGSCVPLLDSSFLLVESKVSLGLIYVLLLASSLVLVDFKGFLCGSCGRVGRVSASLLLVHGSSVVSIGFLWALCRWLPLP